MSRLAVALRLPLAAFCWMTSAYAFTVSSAFANIQFVRPRVFPWIGRFADWHAAASIGWLMVLGFVVWEAAFRSPRAPNARPADRAAAGLGAAGLLACASACVWNLLYPVLPALTEGPRSIVIGIAALVPLVWLAAIDHVRAAGYLAWQRPPEHETDLRAFEGRLLVAALATAAFLTLVYAALTSLALASVYEPELTLSRLVQGAAASLAAHLAVFLPAFLAVALIVRATRRSFALQYGMLATALTAVLAWAFARLVGDALSLHGASGVAAAIATALGIVATWTALPIRRSAAGRLRLDSALDLFFGHSESPSGRTMPVLRLAVVAAAAYGFVRLSAIADWDFVVRDSGLLIVWLAALAAIYPVTPFVKNIRGWTIATAALAPLAGVIAIDTAESWRRPLERYAVHNPSFSVMRGWLSSNRFANPAFDQYLRAHTGLTDVDVQPIDIDFVTGFDERARKPAIFLFVVDSLRPDYLSPYNPSVRFTPRFAEFAADSVVFRNAFTAFGGTGLSVPAIWAGASLVHKQYVRPFHRMNALEKLVVGERYFPMMGLDSVMQPLLKPVAAENELDRGRNVMDYELCQTLDELTRKLRVRNIDTPVFAYSLPQDIHMARLPRTVAPAEAYRAFYAPYATKVHALDACFGTFVDQLKALKMYDNSVIVLTSDHGEMLGEDSRFGHSYHLFPQIVQVPLIVHFPAMLDARTIDPGAVSSTIDITPTLYAALGYHPLRGSRLMGRPLVGVDDRQSTERRRDTYVIAASYGAVYAALRHNGRRLYIADGIRGGDQAFERDLSGRWSEVEISEGLRAVNQLAIRQHIDEIARTYRVRGT